METDLQKQIRELKERVAERTFDRNRNRSRTRIEQVERDAGVFYRFYLQFIATLFWIWQKILRPISKLFWKIGLFLFGWYKKLWSFSVYKRNEFGDLVFSKVRAAFFLLITTPVLFTSGTIALDGSIYAVTQRYNEEIYLFNASDNSFAGDDEFSVTGCEIRDIDPEVGFKCDSEDTVYFRVSPTWIEHFYSIINNGNIFYADNIAATIAPGWNVCVVDSWYFRFKTIYRNTNIYPKLLDASCRPVTVGN